MSNTTFIGGNSYLYDRYNVSIPIPAGPPLPTLIQVPVSDSVEAGTQRTEILRELRREIENNLKYH